MAPPYSPMYPGMATNGMATASLVLGIIALCMFWMPFIGPFMAILGVVFGVLGSARARTMPGEPLLGRARAGLVTSLIAAVVGIGFTMLVISAADGAITEYNSDPIDGFCNQDRYWQDPDCG